MPYKETQQEVSSDVLTRRVLTFGNSDNTGEVQRQHKDLNRKPKEATKERTLESTLISIQGTWLPIVV